MKTGNRTYCKSKKNFILINYFKKARSLAITILLSLVYQIAFPNISLALTGGPTSPDFSSFEPVATTNMVNEFTGQFVYNLPVLEIPGAEGGGYALSLSYHSGDGPETEASWVGAGWTLNPGSILRTRRGLPDDFKGQNISYYNEAPRNWTLSASATANVQAFSVLGGLTNTVRYNNYKGFAFTRSLGLSALSGTFSLGYHISGGEGTYSRNFSPANILSGISSVVASSNTLASSRVGRGILKINSSGVGQFMRNSIGSMANSIASDYISYMITDISLPSAVTPFTGNSWKVNFSATTNLGPVPSGLDLGAVFGYTYQDNIPLDSIPAYGYMYAGDAPDNSNSKNRAIMDYTVEHESRYNPRDLFLPVPSSSPDAFFVSGEGISGAFRMYHQRLGKFSPNYSKSEMDIEQLLGLNVHFGMTLGAGTEATVDNKKSGFYTLEASSIWSIKDDEPNKPIGRGNMDSFYFLPTGDDFRDTFNQYHEPVFFRFNGDLGGKVLYETSNNQLGATASEETGPFMSEDARVLLKDYLVPSATRSGRSSYVGYNTNARIKEKHATTNKRMYAYCHDQDVHMLAGRDNSFNNHLDDLIGEISVTNEDGNNYVYGLPVYAADEQNMQFGMSELLGSNVDNYIVYSDTSNNTTRVGQRLKDPYVTSYLLTSITTPDYIDVNLNGPDQNDFGGYTRFTYSYSNAHQQKTPFMMEGYGYKWRTPYQGYYFNPQRLSDNTDNLGGVQTGYRECYKLKTIETKTHIAQFYYHGVRNDGRGAAINDRYNGMNSGERPDMKYLEPLTRIELFSKSTDPSLSGKLIKVVNFEYDYSVWPGVPNNFNLNDGESGKLTLKRVWFDYNGVFNATLSPYEFHYQYPDQSIQYPSKYSDILDEMNDHINQSPNYEPYIDCWGNYQYDGKERRKKYLVGPDQTPANDYDPAAWQLKRIVLPSGGEIHVQYEQHSYSHVQNRPAHVMVSLKSSDTDRPATGNKYYLNLSDLDIDANDFSEKQRLASLIRKSYSGYFMKYKFFYTLLGTNVQNLSSCNGDYIDGYAEVDDVGVQSGGPHDGDVYVKFKDGPNIPYKMCTDYVKKEVGGKLFNGDCSPASTNGLYQPFSGSNSFAKDIKSLSDQLFKAVAAELDPGKLVCQEMNPALSYLRIPTWNKHGGGVRVKRLLMYDKGVVGGAEGLYGTEYVYEDPITNESWGVATNEPRENTDENPLVTYIPKREPQSKKNRRFNGRDVDQFEGPYSMNVIPQASIGYRQVVKKNIHQDGYTGTGYTVVNYNTVKDYPFDKIYPNISPGRPYSEISRVEGPVGKGLLPKVEIGLFKYEIYKTMDLAQSYSFIMHDMHGKVSAITHYPGVYYPTTNIKAQSFITQTKYDYFEPGEQVPLYNFNNYTTYYDQPGREMDVTVEVRSIQEESKQTRVTGDLTYAQVGPLSMVYPIVLPPITSTSFMIYNTLVSNKLVHYPILPKKTTVVKDGVTSITENIGFDPLTVKPMVTKTYDSYYGLILGGDSLAHQGVYTTTNVPASSQYQQMGQKAWNEKYCYYANLNASDPAIVSLVSATEYTIDSANNYNIFTKGDLVAVHMKTGSINLANVTDISGHQLTVAPATRYNPTLTTGELDKVEIIKSGYENKLTTTMGGMIEYGADPLDAVVAPDSLMGIMNDMMLTARDYPGSTYSDTFFAKYLTNPLIWIDHDSATCDPRWEDYTVSKIAIEKVPSGGAYGHYIYLYIYYESGLPVNAGYGSPGFGLDITDIAHSFSGSSIAHPYGFRYDCACSNLGIEPWWWIYNPSTGAQRLLVGFFCSDPKRKGVLKASVTTFKDDWPYAEAMFNNPWIFNNLLGDMNDYEAGRKGNWRPHETYVHEDETYKGGEPVSGYRNYLGAGKSKHFIKKPWKSVHLNSPDYWIKTNEVLSYTPNGYAFEETDAYGIYSSAKYGYNKLLPYAIAKNAPERSYRFESFEMVYPGDTLEDMLHIHHPGFGPGALDPPAHTGKKFYYLPWSDVMGNPDADAQTLNFEHVLDHDGKGHIIRYWAMAPEDDPHITINVNLENPPVNGPNPGYLNHNPVPPYYNPGVQSWIVYPKPLARAGHWVLFEADCRHPAAIYDPNYNQNPDYGDLKNRLYTYVFRHDGGDRSGEIQNPVDATPIDDIRIQPFESEMTAYVYDPATLKVSAVLDNQHFATFYQYNGEGKLMRKKLETERGTKTVEEAFYNTPKTYNRP